MAEAYPLRWPEGWPRTPAAQLRDGQNVFGKFRDRDGGRYRSKGALTFAEARDSLLGALRRVGARDVVISSNFQLNQAGLPRGDRARPGDQAVAVYFKRRGRDLVMARDAFWRFEENVRSLALALEAMAQLERHGGDLMTERAFTGFAALPPPPSCWAILGIEAAGATPDAVQRAFRDQSRQAHPDAAGGDAERFKALTAARADALRALGAPGR
ncbi:J domain-containing protein [Phenylobacterium sp.]|uniref:J domain-containing protein n=1 Tax=Phenylobacterium sp. TaxID=1871053 RepID=UPI00301BD5B1